MLNLDELVPGETVLVDRANRELVYLARDGDVIWTRYVGYPCSRSWWEPESHKDLTVKQPQLDPSTLEPGDRLRNEFGTVRTYLLSSGEYLLAGLGGLDQTIDVYAYPKNEWKTWKKVEP
jgi:hypothetical protein